MAVAWIALIGTLALGPEVPVQRPKSMGPAPKTEPEPAPEPEPEPDPEPEPEPVEPEIAPVPIESERAPIELDEKEADDAKPPPPNFQRRGILLAPAVGVALCANDWCQGYRAGFWGQADIGYRFGIVAPLIGFGGGVGPYDTGSLGRELMVPFAGDARVTFFDIGAGLLLFPVRNGRLDPFFGARIGYSRVRLSANENSGLKLTETLSRGAVRIGGGLSVFVAESVELGPRFDVTVPFAGDDCVTASFMGTSDAQCFDVKNLEKDARVDSSELALPLSVVIELRVILGV